MSLTTIENIDNYIKSNNYDYFFFQVTKPGISKNDDLEIITFGYINSYYTDISNETIYNYYYDASYAYTPILIIVIKEFYTTTYINRSDYLLINNEFLFNFNLVQNFIENKIISKLNYYNSTFDLTFIQILKSAIQQKNINDVLLNFNNYEYRDISSSVIFNYYNEPDKNQNNAPILLTFIKEFNTLSINKINVLYLTNGFNSFILSEHITNRCAEVVITEDINNTDITFFQVIKNNNMSFNTQITDKFTEYKNKYKVQYNYNPIKSSQIFNIYSSGSKPILIIIIKEYFNNQINTNTYIQLDNNTTLYNIENCIQTTILTTPIGSIVDLKNYLKYTRYELSFIRFLTTKTDSIKASYIITILNEYNNTYKKSYEYIEIVNNIEINNLYKALVKIYPAILLFKRDEYTIDRYRVPCRILSGENYYTENSIIQLKNFIKNSLNY